MNIPSYDALFLNILCISFCIVAWEMKNLNENNSWPLFEPRSGSGSSVGIATGYGLDGPGIESRWETRFSAPVQTDSGVHPASCTMGTGPFPGIDAPGAWG